MLSWNPAKTIEIRTGETGETTRRRKSLFAKDNLKMLCGSTTQTNIGGHCQERHEEVISDQ
jgi:hypothetical protein